MSMLKFVFANSVWAAIVPPGRLRVSPGAGDALAVVTIVVASRERGVVRADLSLFSRKEMWAICLGHYRSVLQAVGHISGCARA